MSANYELKYRDGRVEEFCGHRGYYYVLGPDTLLCFFPMPAWCRHCGAVRLCEDLEPADKIRELLKQVENPESDLYRQFKRPPSAEFIENTKASLRNKLRLWELRTSPPRCMSCGKSLVSFFEDGKWSPHPGTGEEVFFSWAGMSSTDFAMRFFDPEGAELALSDAQRMHYFSLIRANKLLW
jgi:hypothetical protein